MENSYKIKIIADDLKGQKMNSSDCPGARAFKRASGRSLKWISDKSSNRQWKVKRLINCFLFSFTIYYNMIYAKEGHTVIFSRI